jgi:hypothetical protein
MLDHIALIDDVSLGRLAEAMLYYGKVSVFTSETLVNDLCRDLGPERLVAFLDDHKERLQLRYVDWFPCASVSYGGKKREVDFYLGDEATMCVDEPFLRHLRLTGSLPTPTGYVQNRKLSSQLLTHIATDSVSSELFESFFSKDLADVKLPAFLDSWVRQQTPEVPLRRLLQTVNVRFDLAVTPFGGHTVSVKADARIPHELWVDLNEVITTYVVSNLILPIWAQMQSDAYMNEDTAFAVRSGVRAVLNRTARSSAAIKGFEEAIFSHAPAVRQAVDTGARSFREFCTLYERGYKFRKWVDGLRFDAQLVAEYVDAVTADHWSSKLPSKTVRWALFTGAGMAVDALGAGGVGTAVGLGLGRTGPRSVRYVRTGQPDQPLAP